MHMADALLSPAVGTVMWGVAAGSLAYCARQVKKEVDDRRVPLMGVLGAFIFAAQMINFTIPATGSSGHLGGGLLLAILLGPHAAFLTIASVLMVQALFFADGGILALGCNIFNLGWFPAFIAYPLLYRKIVGHRPGRTRIIAAAMVSAVAGLQLGAFSVVLETVASGISSLPLASFLAVMQPIHLAIGIVEGLVTAAIVWFVYEARPEIIKAVPAGLVAGNRPVRKFLVVVMAAALVTGLVFSRYASENPDGLEWSIARVTGAAALDPPASGIHGALAALQERIAPLPDYRFKISTENQGEGATFTGAAVAGRDPGTGVAGGVGALLSLGVIFLLGFLLKKRRRLKESECLP